MYLIYYCKDGVKGWDLAETREELEDWADENLDTSEMSGDDEYDIVNLADANLRRELQIAQFKLESLKKILN